ncbi:DUF6615 family protein [Acinetobacter guillouiae]|uniref:DUF6615 family protein n=1 Tax=Acinetobacter guillouiae TaxID=106649 RepID=UPI002E1D3601
MDLDKLFIKNSAWVWNNLRDARKLKIQLGEESITDFLILNLMKLAASNLKIKTFTRKKEAVNGADWEWWFRGFSGKWLGMRIQAKVLSLSNERYNSLHYLNKNGHQVDLLIKDAQLYNMIPVYCMYSNWDPQKYNKPQSCKSHPSYVRHFGVSLLSVNNVKKFKKNNINQLSKIIVDLIPLHCIVCSNNSLIKDLPTILLENAKNSGLLFDDQFECLLQDNPPHYVQQILNNENMDDLAIDKRLKAITIFQEIISTD